jgi:predicted metal-dependent peptidase
MARKSDIPKAHREAIQAAIAVLARHPLVGSLPGEIVMAGADSNFAMDGYARINVSQDRFASTVLAGGMPRKRHRFVIELNGFQNATSQEWQNAIAQAKLHVVLNHCDPRRCDPAWRTACELEAIDLLRHLSIGVRPHKLFYCEVALPGRSLEQMAAAIGEGGAETIAMFSGFGTAGAGQAAWAFEPGVEPLHPATIKDHSDILARAIRNNISAAVELAGSTARQSRGGSSDPNSMSEQSRRWFVANYPLLAALAASFEIIEDIAVCDQLGIAVAAVDPEMQRIYINPRFPWSREAMDFVMAHELLHVGLRHEQRRQGRDPFLWNVACDYVINGWLAEMGVGSFPTEDLLLDPELALEKDSAEAIYDRITKDLRRLRKVKKLRTLRGIGAVDIICERPSGWWTGPGTDLDSFYRRALADGLDLHLKGVQRGTLPGSLVEEIRALQQPPIPWDVKLGQWLDAYFPPIESARSYRRASRRQGSTPDIPRAVYIRPPDLLAPRTFGVVLDTSGSMPQRLLAYALGAISSYAMSREVPLVRLIQCDAGAHDMGYVEPEALSGRVEIRGRGGTVLMPGIELLQNSDSFPKDAPILVITDGMCDALTIKREHAFLMPEGARLPFATHQPIFHFDRTD